MSTVESGATLSTTPREEAASFIAELLRLQDELDAIERQVDRLEGEVQQVIREAARERFEEYS